MMLQRGSWRWLENVCELIIDFNGAAAAFPRSEMMCYVLTEYNNDRMCYVLTEMYIWI